MNIIVFFVSLFASFIFVIASQQQVNGGPNIAYSNPYVWILSNQLFQLNTEVNSLKQKMKTYSGLMEQMSTLKNDISIFTEKKKQQQQQMETVMKCIREQGTSSTAIERNCRCKYSKECQPGWELYNGHCYYYYYEKIVSWQEAKEIYDNMRSYHVKIETKEEHSWIVGNLTRGLSNSPWIGLNDLNIEGQWSWVSDNSRLSFSAWGPSELNSYRGAEDL